MEDKQYPKPTQNGTQASDLDYNDISVSCFVEGYQNVTSQRKFF